MTREEVLARVNLKIAQLEVVLEARVEPIWSGVAVMVWKQDLDFYRSVRSLIEDKNKGG